MSTPLEQFIEHKVQTGMQCGNYDIDLPKLEDGEQYRFHFDATKCIGCKCCEVACNEQNNNPADIKWRRVGEVEGGVFPEVSQLFNSMGCNHCVDATCLQGCPTESYIKIDNGIVIHDDESCIGCQYCTWNCPYQVPVFHPERHIVTKCHMCYERIERDQTPACVQACPSGAIEIESVNINEWLENDIDNKGNAPLTPDARITNSTTRYTLPENIDENLKSADEHILKPEHAHWPLVFMTVLTQVSLGGFIALVVGELLGMFGLNLPSPSWEMSLVVWLPIAIGLPLSALHLGRPLKALSAMKNIKNSWLSREALALGLFATFSLIVVLLLFFDVNPYIRVMVEIPTMLIGIYGIYSQAMIYRIKARPSWDRTVNVKKFFGVSYVGILLLATAALEFDLVASASSIITLALLFSVVQGFFYLEDVNNFYQFEKSYKLYKKYFKFHGLLRRTTFVLGALVAPMLASTFIAANELSIATTVLIFSVAVALFSELLDRYLFYVTVVPLGMPGGFFLGKARD